jgi:uncharacterized protein YbjT (DUF2867 family)
MIVITGGNLEFGRLVAGQLLDQLPAGQVTVTVRDPRKAGPRHPRGGHRNAARLLRPRPQRLGQLAHE